MSQHKRIAEIQDEIRQLRELRKSEKNLIMKLKIDWNIAGLEMAMNDCLGRDSFAAE